jgi:hypothetical protein
MPREVEAKVSTQFTLLDALMEMEENLKEEKRSINFCYYFSLVSHYVSLKCRGGLI